MLPILKFICVLPDTVMEDIIAPVHPISLWLLYHVILLLFPSKSGACFSSLTFGLAYELLWSAQYGGSDEVQDMEPQETSQLPLFLPQSLRHPWWVEVWCSLQSTEAPRLAATTDCQLCVCVTPSWTTRSGPAISWLQQPTALWGLLDCYVKPRTILLICWAVINNWDRHILD